MASRGDVLASRRSFGFGRGEALEHFLVVQSPSFPGAFGAVVVAPIRRALPALAAWPGAVPIRVFEASATKELVVLVPLIAAAATDRFEAEVRGHADARTMAAVDRVLRALLGLR